MSASPHLPHRRDLALALLLAGLLTLAWAARDWTNLAALRLPDTDDMARLQQVRDWLGGQPFGDLAQHRLGFAGVEMHWSRLADLAPAALITLLTPLIGAHGAEIAAVIAWPALLFVLLLWLTGSIARALGVAPATAMIVAALAYPVVTLFAPGRIDHHGLQLVLLLVCVRAGLGEGNLAKGAALGLAGALSLVVGVETAPLLVLIGAALVLDWLRDAAGAQARLAGFGAAAALALAGAAAVFRGSGWDYPACDGFTAMLWRPAEASALAACGLAITGFVSPGRLTRALLVVLAAAGVAALVFAGSGPCLSPYGQIDPIVARLWLANVAEAQPLLAAPLAHAIGYAGLALVGLVATCWRWRVTGSRDWALLALLSLGALAVALAQLRGAYAAALLGAPALAAMIGRARQLGPLPLVAAWLGSAGLAYPLAAAALTHRTAAPAPVVDCASPAALARLRSLPPGVLMSSVDIGGFALGATRHRAIAAPYHRDGAGLRAHYEFFAAPPARAQELAGRWRLDLVAFCPGEFRAPHGSLADGLERGERPAWLKPLSPPGAMPLLFAVDRIRP